MNMNYLISYLMKSEGRSLKEIFFDTFLLFILSNVILTSISGFVFAIEVFILHDSEQMQNGFTDEIKGILFASTCFAIFSFFSCFTSYLMNVGKSKDDY